MHRVPRSFEGCERGPVFAVCGVAALFALIKLGQRVLRFPFQKYRTRFICLNFANLVFGVRGISELRKNLSLNQPGVEFISMVFTLTCNAQRSIREAARMICVTV